MSRLAVTIFNSVLLLAVSVFGEELQPSGGISLPAGSPFSPVRAVAWSPDGKLIAVGTRGVTVLVFDAASGTRLYALEHHFEDISSVAWRPDGKQFASSSLDGTLAIWQTDSGKLVRSLADGSGPVSEVSWSPDGESIASVSKGSAVTIWDSARGKVTRRLDSKTGPVNAVAWSPHGDELAAASANGEVLFGTFEPERLSEGFKRILAVLFHHAIGGHGCWRRRGISWEARKVAPVKAGCGRDLRAVR